MQSRHKITAQSVRFVYLCLSAPPEVLKGKSRSVYTVDALCFFCQRERRNANVLQRNVTWVHFSFLGSLCKMEQGIYM